VAYWKKYDIPSFEHRFLFKYMHDRKSGVKGWIKYQICRRWHGEHDFSEKPTKYPTPFRKKVCRKCESEWWYSMPTPPPRFGHIYVECPRCFAAVDHNPQKVLCDCYKCGKRFKYEDF